MRRFAILGAAVLALALSTAVLWALILALSPTVPPGGSFTDCGTRCPHNALQISGHAATGAALSTAFNVVFTISLIGIAMLMFNNALSSARLRRRAIASAPGHGTSVRGTVPDGRRVLRIR